MVNKNVKTDLEIRALTRDNLHQYQDAILSSEEQFHPDLREDLASLTEVLSSRGFVGKVACLNNKYIGNVLGFSPTEEQIEEMGLLGVRDDLGSIYLTNFVINLLNQDQGFGTLLLGSFVKEANQKGFKTLEGHFRNSTASLHLAKKFGAEELRVYHDWQGTGEDYTHCRIRLIH